MSSGLDTAVHAYRPRSQLEKGLLWGLAALIFCGYLTAIIRYGAGLMKRVLGVFCLDTDSSTSEEWQAVVQRRMLELRVSRMRVYLLLVSGFYFPWLLAVVAGLASGSFQKMSTPESEISWLVFLAAVALVLCKPAVMTPRNLDVASLCVVAHCVIQETPFVCCTEEGFNINKSGTQLIFIMGLSVVRGLGSLRETIVRASGNALFVGFVIYTRWNALRSEVTGVKLAESAVSYGSILAVSMVLGAVIETGYRQLVIQGLQLAEAKEMHKAATALLRSCHDVVVELDSSGSLSGDSQDLGSLLLRANHQRSMHGLQLSDLIQDEEDRRSFQGRLAASRTKSVGLAENMHVTMKDALGNILHMEMMWFACKRAQGDVHFIVGIREFGDRAYDRGPGPSSWAPDFFPAVTSSPSEASSQEAHRGPSHSPSPWAPDFFPCVTSLPSEASSPSEGTASASMSQSESLDVDAEVEQAMIVIDTTHASYPIRRSTTGFRTQVGYMPRNAPLSRFVNKHEPMLSWLQDGANSVLNRAPLPPDYNVSLRMPHGKLRACCRLVVTGEEAEMPDVYLQNVAVLFYDIIHRRSRNTESRNAESRSGGVNGTPARPAPGPLGRLTL